MNDVKENAERTSEETMEAAVELISLGSIVEKTKGVPSGWNIEAGANPFYF